MDQGRFGQLAGVLLVMLWVGFTRSFADVSSEGLLHYWPDPAEGTDVVTGRRGVQRGFGPSSGSGDRFGHVAGWVELGPGITNQTFTLTCWLSSGHQSLLDIYTIVSQDSGLGDGWSFGVNDGFQFLSHSFGELAPTRFRWPLVAGWQAIALRVSPHQIDVWTNGVLARTAQLPFRFVGTPGPLCVGNVATGQQPWGGDVRDLRFYSRGLTEAEIADLARQPRSAAVATWPPSEQIPCQHVSVRPALIGDYQRTQFTTDDGLPSLTVQTIAQDRDGALFIGFEEGLVRYDGVRFQLTDGTAPEFAATGPDVGTLCFDRSGDLWLGTFHGPVFRRDQTWRSFVDLGPARFVRRILPNNDRTVWLAAARDELPRGPFRLQHLDQTTGRLLSDYPLAGQVRELCAAPGGLWIATDEPDALWHFQTNSGRLRMAALLTVIKESNLHGETESPRVLVSKEFSLLGLTGEVWIDERLSLQWAQIRLGEMNRSLNWSLRLGESWTYSESREGISSDWVGTRLGLLRRHADSWEKVDLGDSDRTVTFLSPNAEGGVWAATKDSGFWLVRPFPAGTLTQENGLDHEDILSVTLLKNGNVLAAGDLGSVSEISVDSGDISLLQSPADGGRAVELSDGGILRLPNTAHYLFKAAGPRADRYVLSRASHTGADANFSEVSQLHVAKNGRVWIVDQNAVVEIWEIPPAPDSKPFPLEEGKHFSLWLDQLPRPYHLVGLAEHPEDGSIWIGSFEGLYRIFEGKVEHFSDPRRLRDNPCVPLGFGSDGWLWLGSEAGLGRFRNGQFQWVPPGVGLSGTVVSDAEEVDGHLWVTGRQGIDAVRLADLELFFAGKTNRIAGISLGLADGLRSTESRILYQPVIAKTGNGKLWIGTDRGVVHFKPAEVLAGLNPPPISIQAVIAEKRSIPRPVRGEPMVLAPGEGNSVEFRFSSLSFRSPGRSTFQYALSGPSGTSSETTTQGHVHFTNLKPGRHTFSVKARSGNGLVSLSPATVDLIVLPYFYETLPFQVGATLAGGSLLGFWLSRRIRKERIIANLENEGRLSAERERIASDMHDHLGACLTKLAWRTGSSDATDLSRQGDSPALLAQEALAALDETVWSVNPSKDQLSSVVNYLDAWVRRHFAGTTNQLSVTLPTFIPEVPVTSEWRHHVLSIVKEASGNVLKHASASEVSLEIAMGPAGDVFTLILADNGIGFEVANASRPSPNRAATGGGNGLGNLTRRAKELKARLTIDSAPGRGTTLRLDVPIPAKA